MIHIDLGPAIHVAIDVDGHLGGEPGDLVVSFNGGSRAYSKDQLAQAIADGCISFSTRTENDFNSYAITIFPILVNEAGEAVNSGPPAVSFKIGELARELVDFDYRASVTRDVADELINDDSPSLNSPSLLAEFLGMLADDRYDDLDRMEMEARYEEMEKVLLRVIKGDEGHNTDTNYGPRRDCSVRGAWRIP